MNSDDTQALRDLAARVFARTWDSEAYELATAVPGLLDTLAMRNGQLIQARANATETLARVQPVVEALRAVAAELVDRERQHTGHGRDGHLNEDDLASLIAAVDQMAPRPPPTHTNPHQPTP